MRSIIVFVTGGIFLLFGWFDNAVFVGKALLSIGLVSMFIGWGVGLSQRKK